MSPKRQSAVVKALAEAASIRATVRLTGAAKDTVTKLLVAVGTACVQYQDRALRKLNSRRVQCDEIWAFVGAQQKNVRPSERGQGKGDVWTWTAMDADSKLMFSWYVGERSLEAAKAFMVDVAGRLHSRVQLTTDGLSWYRPAVEEAFSSNGVDYAMLVKTYSYSSAIAHGSRYSPGVCTGAEKTWVMGEPDPKHVSTSYVDRSNLTLRMQSRRFTRLTNAFSKKVAKHAHAVALHFMYYNFCKPHGTLTKAKGGIQTSPAMAAGVADHVWKVEEIVALLPIAESRSGRKAETKARANWRTTR